ncbi:hypothetical protein B0T18DRAFT_444153 [Schizothecium vesticola]|uniref:Mating pheromone n=1 Tax=Schizothecium vesticola TaxID=314040 RepID=A0AA40F5P2_9PEZI|nr:hypothetical protein B0T18DRAFT_444153 [Schizothecium vesticola]
MKVTSPLFIFAIAAAVDAAAVADLQEDKRWCVLPGQPCFKRDAVASAMTESLQSAGGLSVRDDGFSPSAAVAKRQIDALALAIAASQANPSAYYYGLNLPSHFAPEATEAETTTEKRDASPWCVLPGQPCFKKREANPWCVLPGQPCFKKRDTISVPDRRDASPWCVLPGQPCFKKRSVEEEKRWCVLRGQPCFKRDAEAEASCNTPGGACTLAQRDLHAVYSIARSIVDAHSE